jgi:hypothetical protein
MKDAKGHGSNPRGTHASKIAAIGLRVGSPEYNKAWEDLARKHSFAELSKQAYGVQDDDIVTLRPSQIKIQYHGDLENPEDKFKKGGMGWVKSVDFSTPVDVEVKQDGNYYLADGHHRWFAAGKLGDKPLRAKVQVKARPIETILRKQGAR